MTDELINEYITLRRRIVEADFLRLNPMQRQAVLATEGPLLLLAGAGSGKTTVIINRIANILKYGRASDSDEAPDFVTHEDVDFLRRWVREPNMEQRDRVTRLVTLHPAEPWRVIAITFTNKAAGELKSRLEAMLGETAGDIWASTFHSSCVRILRRDIDKLDGFSSSFTIYDSNDSLSLMKRILKELDIDDKILPPKSVLSAISAAKDSMQTAEDFAAAAEGGLDRRKKQLALAYAEYAKRLKAANALDFDDLILHTVRLLESNDQVREYWQNRFKYVLVDEYQDTSILQYRLVALLAGKWRNICVVGDDDQSIYRFRGATIENILSFEEKYSDARTIRLEQNYRSTGHILNAANSVIRRNTARKGKELWTKNSEGDLITMHKAMNEQDEARYVVSEMVKAKHDGASWKDFAVLYRMNAQANQMEFALKRGGVPYRVVGGMKFFDRAEIKDMLSYLCVISNPGDDLRLSRIVNVPARQIGAKTIETIRGLASESGESMFEVMKHSPQMPELRSSAAKLLVFTDMIGELKAAELPPDQLYDLLLDKSGYKAMLEMKDDQENITRLENIMELKSNIISYLKENPLGDLDGFLAETALFTDIDKYDEETDSAVLMTIHSAKGLEFPTVFIIGAEDGIFPGIRAIGEQEELEEERRLCYVAMTRAKKRLFITAAAQRMLFGKTSANPVSRFIDEIPEEDIVKPAAKSSGGFGFNAPGVSHSATGSGDRTREWSFDDVSGPEDKQRRLPAQRQPAKKLSSAPDVRKQSSLSLSPGERIEHKAFGAGSVVSVKQTGGDALLEIEFEKAGKKRLMLNFAAEYIKKI